MPMPLIYLKLILALLVFMGIIGFVLFLNWADRSRIQRLMESQGAKIESILPLEGPFWVRILTQRSVTHWQVIYRDGQGKRRKALCTAMFLRCFVEKDEEMGKG